MAPRNVCALVEHSRKRTANITSTNRQIFIQITSRKFLDAANRLPRASCFTPYAVRLPRWNSPAKELGRPTQKNNSTLVTQRTIPDPHRSHKTQSNGGTCRPYVRGTLTPNWPVVK